MRNRGVIAVSQFHLNVMCKKKETDTSSEAKLTQRIVQYVFMCKHMSRMVPLNFNSPKLQGTLFVTNNIQQNLKECVRQLRMDASHC